jgi:drug/metabolite transporter (DMT)-like permease
MTTEETFRPVLAAGMGVFVLSLMDAVMKFVSAAYPIGQVVGLRYGSGALFAILAFAAMRAPAPGFDAVIRNLKRAVIVLCTATCFFTAIARLPLAQAIALTFLAPLLMALLGRLILKEPVAPRALIGIVIGLIGVAVIAEVEPQGKTGNALDPLGLAAALACAFFYALSMVLMRQQSAKDSTITIVTLSNLFALLLAVPVMAWQWQPVRPAHAAIFALAGFLGTCGHLCLAWAYARAHAGRLGVLEYTAFLWASLLGFVFFSEIPTFGTIAGAGLIMVACAFAALSRPRPAASRRPAVDSPVPSLGVIAKVAQGGLDRDKRPH